MLRLRRPPSLDVALVQAWAITQKLTLYLLAIRNMIITVIIYKNAGVPPNFGTNPVYILKKITWTCLRWPVQKNHRFPLNNGLPSGKLT